MLLVFFIPLYERQSSFWSQLVSGSITGELWDIACCGSQRCRIVATGEFIMKSIIVLLTSTQRSEVVPHGCRILAKWLLSKGTWSISGCSLQLQQ